MLRRVLKNIPSEAVKKAMINELRLLQVQEEGPSSTYAFITLNHSWFTLNFETWSDSWSQ